MEVKSISGRKLYPGIIIACSLLTLRVFADAPPPPAAVPPPPPPPAWHGEIGLGAALARGNTDTLLLNANASAHREWKHDEVKFGADGQYGINNWGQGSAGPNRETESTDAMHGFVDYKHLFTDRFFGDLRIDGFYDGIAAVHYRVIVGPAAGYYFMKSDENRLSGLVGPSFIEEKVGSPSHSKTIPGQHAESGGYMTLRISERYEHNFSKTTRVWEQIDYYPKVDDFNQYLLNSEVGAEAALNTRLTLRIVFADKFNSKPPEGRKENDMTLISSIVYKY